MKTITCSIILISCLVLISCKQKDAKHSVEESNNYPPELNQVFKAHGGLEKWNKQHTLSFKIGKQRQTIDLRSRNIRITSSGFSMGSNNGNVWLKQDSDNFKGSPRYYHSLMFYFFTMPFVFADEGINYRQTPDKKIHNINYKGLKMSFEADVGDAPNDEYIMYYHPNTYEMEWLAYTSTYNSGERSDNFNIIHYRAWKRTNGFLLPAELQWHKYKNGRVGQAKGNAKIFTNVSVLKEKMKDDFYNIPKNAKIDRAGTQ